MEALGEPSFWSPPEDATPEQLTEWETQSARMLVPDESITAWVDVADVLDQRWDAIKAHVTQISEDNPFVRFGKDAWAEFWHKEAFVRRESRIPAPDQETDLFEGLGRDAGRRGWGPEPRRVTTGAVATSRARSARRRRDRPRTQSLNTPWSLPASWTISSVSRSKMTTPMTPCRCWTGR